MELSLRRRLDGVAKIVISQPDQTARIDFAAGDVRFSPAEFRTALENSGLELVTLEVEVCGGIEAGDRSLVFQANRLLLEYAAPFPHARIVCVAGLLDDRSQPATLRVTAVTSTTD